MIVETDADLTVALEAGADAVQGFYCHRPTVPTDLVGLTISPLV